VILCGRRRNQEEGPQSRNLSVAGIEKVQKLQFLIFSSKGFERFWWEFNVFEWIFGVV
jgi:hypothetical protein